MTLRQAMSRQWQIPLFAVSLAAFAVLLLQLRPEMPVFDFEHEYVVLEQLAAGDRYEEFYPKAEVLRLQAEDEMQLGRMHGLAADTRTQQLKRRHELGVDSDLRRSSPVNYQTIVQDYREALRRNAFDPNGPDSAEVYRNVSLAFWCLNEPEKAISHLNKAISVSEKFDPSLHGDLVKMYLAARPSDYLSLSMKVLNELLDRPEAGDHDKAWAFVRRAEILIAQGHEDQALEQLNNAQPQIRQSPYGEELELLRGRALRHAGQLDQADLILRELIQKMTDRGDIYAQTALELGKVNYQQYRDYDARYFYELVANTQMGKDWYIAAKAGLAQCAALQQRYDQAISLYQEAIDLLVKVPYNRSITASEIQQSLALLAHQLTLNKRYPLALAFLEIEQQIAPESDLQAADRFARAHKYWAEQLLRQMNQAQQAVRHSQPTDTELQWIKQQRQLIKAHFEQAARQFLRVVSFAVGDDDLYAESLGYAATCYDKAGNAEKTIDTWGRYVRQCEGRPEWPAALFNLAQAHQALGQYSEAITFYENLRRKHPRLPAALRAAVPLAKSHLAKDPPDREKAEQLLRSLLANRALTPAAEYFRDAMFELGQLYYDSKKYKEAINVLTEATDRYPDDAALGLAMFLVGDSYRNSGLILDTRLAQLAEDPTATAMYEKAADMRSDFLENAYNYFDRAINFYSHVPEGRRSPLDKAYLRYCWLYRADCLFDLGRYRQAADAYEAAALSYHLTPAALTAFVQITNCQIKLGNINEARSANQRVRWQLTQMSDEDLDVGPMPLSRQQWQDWFDWTGQSGLW